MRPRPPKPRARAGRVPLWRYARLFRDDILAAQPARLYRAWMAEFRTPFFHSFMVNDPALLRTVLQDRPGDFPKSARVAEGLRPLLGRSVFVTNGAYWAWQRRLIDPAFAGGRLRDTFPAMRAAGEAAVARLGRPAAAGEPVEIEAAMSHVAADVIFRTLFSIPITNRLAERVFGALRTYQRAQPVLNPAALLRLPRWVPRRVPRRLREAAQAIRDPIRELCAIRLAEIEAGRAPDDLSTKIMTARDGDSGEGFDLPEMVDQVAIFFLAGHETSASALSWALYLLARDPEAQSRVAAEAAGAMEGGEYGFEVLSRLAFTRDVFRETLRLYPPVPMMVREAAKPERFRGRKVPQGAQIVLSPWHLHRHERLWPDPDDFDPDRWSRDGGAACPREAWMPFSAGPRVCTGAGFAMAEGVLLLAQIVRAFALAPAPGPEPVPVAHLTVRARDGIRLRLTPR